jgi:phenylacetic acid degradation protein PaaD
MEAAAEEDGPRRDPQEVAIRAGAVMWAGDRASQAMGMTLEEIAPGRAVLRMPVRDDMLNGHGTCHGGHVFTLADSAFAFACNSGGRTNVAQAADITFLAPAHSGDVLVATAVERHRRGRTGITDVTVVDAVSGEAVAEFRGRSREVGGSFID